jgi:hypothetical protein
MKKIIKARRNARVIPVIHRSLMNLGGGYSDPRVVLSFTA